MIENANRTGDDEIERVRSRVLVIGGGVSGSAAAIRFAHYGCDVTLVERAVFPREKICGCCLGAAGLNALDAIGIGEQVRRLGIATHTFAASLPSRTSVGPTRDSTVHSSLIRLPIALGVAISRSTLDEFLIDQARRAGVCVKQPFAAQVLQTEGDRTLVRFRSLDKNAASTAPATWQNDDAFELVVLATGLTGVFSGSETPVANEDASDSAASARRWRLPWIASPHGPLGIGVHLSAAHRLSRDWDLPSGEIQMVCNDEGYVGLVRLPGGDIDIAAALSSQKQRRGTKIDAVSGERHEDVSPASTVSRLADLLSLHPGLASTSIDELHDWLHEQAEFMTAPPLRRRRQSGNGRVVAIGDCAGYVEPMTGEGMTWGIESGLAVADLWHHPHARSDFANRWEVRQRSLQAKRRILCSSVTLAMRSATLRRVMRFGLMHTPWLARPITRGLARGPRFAKTAGKNA